MSKTNQRRRSAYALGREDAVTGRRFRWYKHPHMRQYRAGYNSTGRQHVFSSTAHEAEIEVSNAAARVLVTSIVIAAVVCAVLIIVFITTQNFGGK